MNIALLTAGYGGLGPRRLGTQGWIAGEEMFSYEEHILLTKYFHNGLAYNKKNLGQSRHCASGMKYLS